MLWVFHWGKKQFHSPNETPYLQNEIVFLRIETPFCEIFCIFAVSIKNTVLTLSFAFSKITEKKLANPRMGKPTFFVFSLYCCRRCGADRGRG